MAAPSIRYELATVVHRFGKGLMEKQRLNPVQIKALHNIVQCRTATMGGHQEVCEHCQQKRYSYNSCGDRHCPKCQATKQALWVEEVTSLTLPIKHYHIIFTVPHELNKVCLWNPTLYYNLLFSAVWRTLHSFGYSEYGVETGAIAVLHSWGQNLSLHPHIHSIVPAAGYSLKAEWKRIGKQKFLYPVYALSKTFKGKFLDSLRRKLKKLGIPHAFHNEIQLAYKPDWVVFSEASLASAEHVIRYLGQYKPHNPKPIAAPMLPHSTLQFSSKIPEKPHKVHRPSRDVVQPGILAGSCRPLIFLYVAHSFYFLLLRIVVCFPRKCSYNSSVVIDFRYRFF